MTHFFDRRDLWGNRYNVWIVAAMAFVAPLCLWSIRQIHPENDGEIRLPSGDAEQLKLEWTHRLFPVNDRVFLTWNGSSINDLRMIRLAEELAGKKDERGTKRGGSPYVASAIEPRSVLDEMQRNGIAPQEAVRRLEGTMVGSGPLRLRLTEASRSALRKTKRELQTAMLAKFGMDVEIVEAAPDLMSVASIPVPAVDGANPGESSPPAVLSAEGKLIENQTGEHDLELTWKGMCLGNESTIDIARWLTEHVPQRGDDQPLVERAFFVPGSPAALTIELSEAGMADKTETVAVIRAACHRVGIPGESVHMVGNAVSAAALTESVSKVGWNSAHPLLQIHLRSALLASGLIAIVLAYGLLLNVKLATIVSGVSLFAVYCMAAFVPMTSGSNNLGLIVLPTLVLVVTMSGAFQVVNYWLHASSNDDTKAIVETARASWVPSFQSFLMLAIGPISLCLSALEPVRHFGITATIGLTVSLLMMMFGLPSIVQMWKGKTAQERDPAAWQFFGKLFCRRSGLQSAITFVICLGICLGAIGMRIDLKSLRYFPERAQIVRDCWYFETNLAGVKSVDAIIRFDEAAQKSTTFLDRMEAVRQVQEKLRAHPDISGCISIADYQPTSERLAEDASFLQRSKYNRQASAVQQRILDGEISGARSFYTVAEKSSDLELAGDGRLNQPGDELWRIAARVHAMNHSDFSVLSNDLHRITQETLKLHPGSGHVIAGDITVTERLQNVFLRGATTGIIATYLTILVVFIIRMRGLLSGIVATIPSTLSIGMVVGLLTRLNQPVDIGVMIAAPIAMGLAACGTLHYLNWMHSSMKKGKSRQEAICEALAACGPVIWQSSVVVAISMFPLMYAEFAPIGRFGLLLVATAAASCLTNVVLLPMLMGSPLGRFFEVAQQSTELKPMLVEETTVPAETVQADNAEPSMPEPHIKPHNPATKKRRASPRRDLDAG